MKFKPSQWIPKDEETQILCGYINGIISKQVALDLYLYRALLYWGRENGTPESLMSLIDWCQDPKRTPYFKEQGELISQAYYSDS